MTHEVNYFQQLYLIALLLSPKDGSQFSKPWNE